MTCKEDKHHEIGKAKDLCHEVITKKGHHFKFLPSTEGLNSCTIPRKIKGKMLGDIAPDNSTNFGNAMSHVAFDKSTGVNDGL